MCFLGYYLKTKRILNLTFLMVHVRGTFVIRLLILSLTIFGENITASVFSRTIGHHKRVRGKKHIADILISGELVLMGGCGGTVSEVGPTFL